MRKIGYLILVLLTLYVSIMYDGDAGMFLLAFELMLAVFLYMVSWYFKFHVKAELYVQIPVVEKGKEFPVELRITNTGILPISMLKARMYYESDYSKDVGKHEITLGLGPKGSVRHKELFTMSYCGRIYFFIDTFRVYDYLKIFSKKLKFSDSIFVNILPNIQEIPMFISPETRLYMADSDEYDPHQKGDDVTEIFALREYRPGDSMKSIHWKLSARLEQWMVKEFSKPEGVQVLLLLDLYHDRAETYGARRMDKLLETFASLSFSMMEQGVRHTAAWFDDTTGQLMKCLVENEEDAYEMVDLLLAAVPYIREYDILEGYDKEYPGEKPAATVLLKTSHELIVNGESFADFGGKEEQVIL